MIAVILKIFGPAGTIALATAVLLAMLSLSFGIQLKVATAQKNEAIATSVAAINDRDAALVLAENNFDASAGWEKIADERGKLLIFSQEENRRLRAENDQAIARAEAKRQDAERTLSEFTSRYAASIRIPACAQARQQLEAACPAISY